MYSWTMANYNYFHLFVVNLHNSFSTTFVANKSCVYNVQILKFLHNYFCRYFTEALSRIKGC